MLIQLNAATQNKPLLFIHAFSASRSSEMAQLGSLYDTSY